MAKNSKQTSAKAATAASKVLRDGRTSKSSKTAAGSALSQKLQGKLSNLFSLSEQYRAVAMLCTVFSSSLISLFPVRSSSA